MIKEEFKSTQAFMYPDEYNVYDQTKEACMKKFNSKQQAGGELNWKVPDFSGEEGKLKKFRDQDDENLRGLQRLLKRQKQDDRNMERFLERQALNYYEYQKNRVKERKDGKSSKTLRTVLAENFQELLKRFPEQTEKRFPHTSYG